MILPLISSGEGSIRGGTPEEVHTVTNKVQNCISRIQAHLPILILHQCNDIRERSRLDDPGSDIILRGFSLWWYSGGDSYHDQQGSKSH